MECGHEISQSISEPANARKARKANVETLKKRKTEPIKAKKKGRV
jgi:hypothetical protein